MKRIVTRLVYAIALALALVSRSWGDPATGQAPSAGGDQPPSIWKQDNLTGNWDGFRDELVNHGVTISSTYVTEVFGNPSGGARRGVVNDGQFSIALDLNLEKMSDAAIFKDLTIHANALYNYGAALSDSFVGNFNNTSNIEAYNSVRLQELWVQKLFWDKRLSLKIGNMAVDTEFFQSSSSALFMNATMGTMSLIANNVPNVPIYPVASPGVRLMLTLVPSFYVMTGVYGMDDDSDPAVNNKNGTRFALNGESGMLIMSEAGWLLNQAEHDHGLQGTYRLGSFVHTANYTTWDSQANFANGTGSLQSAGADYGIYGVIDQQIYAHESEAISLFLRGGGAPSNTNFVDYYVDGGFNFTGFIPGRDCDVAGIGVSWSHVSDAFSDSQVAQGNPPSSAETVIEATYKIQLAPWWSIQPDAQYIVTPGAVEGSKNAAVIGVRTSIAF